MERIRLVAIEGFWIRIYRIKGFTGCRNIQDVWIYKMQGYIRCMDLQDAEIYKMYGFAKCKHV